MKMATREAKRLTGRELHALFDELFPSGFAGVDVLAEIAPEGWEHSPLLACFHPSVDQLFEERVMLHRNLEELRQLRRKRQGETTVISEPEPTLEDVRREYEPSPMDQHEEVTELVGLCLWDIFSDNHDDGADIGSFRGPAGSWTSTSRATRKVSRRSEADRPVTLDHLEARTTGRVSEAR